MATSTPTNTPTPKATPEKVYFGGITESQLAAYAGKCKFCYVDDRNFFIGGEKGYHHEVVVRYTDKYVRFAISDPTTWEVVAWADAMVAVTLDGDRNVAVTRNPKLVLVALQAERVSKPGQNFFWVWTNWMLADPLNMGPYSQDKSIHDFSEVARMVAGTFAEVAYKFDEVDRWSDDAWYLSNTLLSNPVYVDELKSLFETNGESIDNNAPPLLWTYALASMDENGCKYNEIEFCKLGRQP
ncbi:MAG: hypothetical protein WAV56_02635 [Microgenomates group bacterium]